MTVVVVCGISLLRYVGSLLGMVGCVGHVGVRMVTSDYWLQAWALMWGEFGSLCGVNLDPFVCQSVCPSALFGK